MSNLIKRIIADFLIVVFAFVLQSTVFFRLSIGNAIPDVLLIAVCSVGFMRGRREGLAVGALAGLVMDIFNDGIIGLYVLVFMYLGYFSGLFSKRYFSDDVKLPLAIITASDLIYHFILYVCTRFLWGDFNFGFYFVKLIVPNIIYTFGISLPIYLLLIQINKWLDKKETRNAQRLL